MEEGTTQNPRNGSDFFFPEWFSFVVKNVAFRMVLELEHLEGFQNFDSEVLKAWRSFSKPQNNRNAHGAVEVMQSVLLK